MWLHDKIVTGGTEKNNGKKTFTKLEKLQNTGHRASEKKSELLREETTLLGHEIKEKGTKTEERKNKSHSKIKTPEIK